MFQNSSLSSVSADITRNIAGSLPRVPRWQGLGRIESLLPLPRTFQEYVQWLPLIAGITLLALLQVWTSLQISQTEVELNTLRRQYVLQEQENAQLLWEISQFTTLERVREEATAAGYVPALKRRYVTATTTPDLYPDFSAPTAQTEEATGPAENDAAKPQFAIDFTPIWNNWIGQWEQWRQTIQTGAETLGNNLQQQIMQIDLSRLTGTEQPQE